MCTIFFTDGGGGGKMAVAAATLAICSPPNGTDPFMMHASEIFLKDVVSITTTITIVLVFFVIVQEHGVHQPRR